MTFQESVRAGFIKYADFSGRASRSEYWWFVLFLIGGGLLMSIVSNLLSLLFTIATVVPAIAAATRRLHDTGRSGWWQLVCLVPFVGLVIIIVMLALPGKPEAESQGLTA
jgi:uncharacterized membrane protein YhaH (DUF805 family)